jgi:hypothetical protein
MGFYDAFFGSDQSQLTAYAIIAAIIAICITILLTATDVPVSNRILIVFFVIVTLVPSVFLTLFELTCIVTGGTEPNRWWCYAFAWVLAAFIIIYCTFIVIISLISLFTYNSAIDNVKLAEQNDHLSPEQSNDYAKEIIKNERNIEKFYNQQNNYVEKFYNSDNAQLADPFALTNGIADEKENAEADTFVNGPKSLKTTDYFVDGDSTKNTDGGGYQQYVSSTDVSPTVNASYQPSTYGTEKPPQKPTEIPAEKSSMPNPPRKPTDKKETFIDSPSIDKKATLPFASLTDEDLDTGFFQYAKL